jgi:hypothetical protein
MATLNKGATMIRKGAWLLVYTHDRVPVNVGDIVRDFRGDTTVVTDGIPPHHEGSTGRVCVREAVDGGYEMSYYPSVYGLMWVTD